MVAYKNTLLTINSLIIISKRYLSSSQRFFKNYSNEMRRNSEKKDIRKGLRGCAYDTLFWRSHILKRAMLPEILVTKNIYSRL